MRFLAGLPLKDAYWRYIEVEIKRLFDEVLFKPLYHVIQEKPEVRNSTGALVKAMEDGTVWYEDGEFYGTYNARISADLKSIGATFNSRKKTWSFSGTLPHEVSMAALTAAVRYQSLRQVVLQTLSDINIESINRISEIPDKYVQTIHWLEGDFQKAVAGVTIPPKLTQDQVGSLAAEWGMNLDLYVRGWIQSDIIKMRQLIQGEILDGRRAESIAEIIRQQFSVSRRKAQFLARQETALLMSAYHRERFKDAGITKFRWSTSNDERVRDDHQQLEGRVFAWDNPPFNSKGQQIWPGTDFNCRCIAIPVLE